MERYDYVIIGGGIAGVTAAETIRERDKNATITIISTEPHVLYSRVLLPYYLKKRIPREKLFLRTINDFTEKQIDMRLLEEVVGINPEKHEVDLKSGASLLFKKLLIASGGQAKQWGTAVDQPFLYRLQTIDDADRLMQDFYKIKKAVVIGSSFIGLEFLEIFTLRKIPVVLLMRDIHFFSKLLDARGGALMQKNFVKHGIDVRASEEITTVTPVSDALEVSIKAGREKVSCNAICLGIGIERSLEFAEKSGIAVGDMGIKANEFLETNYADIFVAGDIAEFYDVLCGTAHVDGNWTNAFLQGKRAGLAMTGEREAFRNISSYSITNLGFQITAIGECDPQTETVVRMNEEHNGYERFFIRNGILAGAVLINRFSDKLHLARLIETKSPLAAYRGELDDFRFDISSIPVIT